MLRPPPRPTLFPYTTLFRSDRHDNLTVKNVESGMIDPELVAAVVRAAGAPAVVETPGGAEGQSADIAYLRAHQRSEEHTSELQSQSNLVCRLLLEKKKRNNH